MRPFAFVLIAAVFPIAMNAQGGCPGDVNAIPLQRVSQHQMVVGVSINGSGPYDFLLDTGTQMTVVDLALAADLHLKSTGNAQVAGVSFQGPALYSKLDRLEVSGHKAINRDVLVYNMNNVQSQGFAIRGLLGEDFLSGYDVLIDRERNVLCIDDTGAMLGRLRGERVSLISSTSARSGVGAPVVRAPR